MNFEPVAAEGRPVMNFEPVEDQFCAEGPAMNFEPSVWRRFVRVSID